MIVSTCHPNTQEALAGRFHAQSALTRAKKIVREEKGRVKTV